MMFSIIVPVYKVEKYLDQCIKSVLSQSFSDFELILVDDGSPDGCPKICDYWSEKDSRVKVIHKLNGGLSDARNKGLEIAEGQYIIFLDSDDYWLSSDVLKRLYSKLKNSNLDVLSFNFIKNNSAKPYFKAFDEKQSLIEDANSLKIMLDNEWWIACAWNKVIRRELFLNNNLKFIKGITSEDIDWCLRLALVADSFGYLDEIAVCYRQREDSISNSMTMHKTTMLYENIKRCLSLLSNSGNQEKVELLRSYVTYQYGTLLHAISLLDNGVDKKTMIEQVSKYQYLLSDSKNKKIRMLFIVSKLGGIKMAIYLLKIRNKLL